MKEVFWIDSKMVLGYINNDVRRFYVFVGNCVQEICEWIFFDQWYYVGIKFNFVDVVFCGIGV